MCLVSLVVKEDKIILTSNRDESPDRSSEQIKKEIINANTICYPADSAGGSWIFCSDNGTIICLLNGAFLKHQRKLPYKMSRGMMMKSYFQFDNAVDFIEKFDFLNIEPFTIIIVSNDKSLEFIWDGQIKHIKQLNDKKEYLWSSTTLYDENAIRLRQKWYDDLRKQYFVLDSDELIKIHLTGGNNDESNGFIMDRMGLVQTISLTQIVKDHKAMKMIHINLLTRKQIQHTLEIINSQ